MKAVLNTVVYMIHTILMVGLVLLMIFGNEVDGDITNIDLIYLSTGVISTGLMIVFIAARYTGKSNKPDYYPPSKPKQYKWSEHQPKMWVDDDGHLHDLK